ncbi:hypothetical protein BH10ACT2_BH10ACT2_13040 [soil metagenome]
MELSPQAIRSIGFALVKKGYDPDQVDAFRDEIATVVETAHNQAIAMEARARAAVAKLHEVSQHAPERAHEGFSANDNDVITRTLALAQRAADTTIAEAHSEAESLVAQSRDEAERLLDNARTVAAKTIEDSRADARRAVEGDRVQAENELQSLLARRDFLLSDVDHLEQHLQAQRERLRDAAVALQEMVDRVPAGLGEIRRPLLSASAEPVADAPSASARREIAEAIDGSAANRASDSDAAEHATVFDDLDDPDYVDSQNDVSQNDVSQNDAEQEEMSELVWDDASIAAAERATELPFRPSSGPPQRPGSRPPTNSRRGPSSPPFNDPLEQDSVWRMLDDEVASTQAAEAGVHLDEITAEVPIIPRTAETFRVGGDELQ